MATLRDAYISNDEHKNTRNQMTKTLSIYVLGPSALIVSGGVALMITYKK